MLSFCGAQEQLRKSNYSIEINTLSHQKKEANLRRPQNEANNEPQEIENDGLRDS